MASVTYAIVFSGEIVEGFQVISVKAHMAKLLKADAEKMQALFSGKTIVLKRTTDKAEAARYVSVLKKAGASVRVKIIKSDPAAAAKTATPASKAPAATPEVPDADFTLRPNEGNLFEPEPEVESPDLDLSEFSVAENDGTPLIEEKEYEQADIDLSEYSVAENDGSNIIEPAPEVPKLDAPDFGLDEPGAMLDTIKEDVELLDPDTTGMSLAFPGTDLLNKDEKKGKPPPPPDTSKITLISNFDI